MFLSNSKNNVQFQQCTSLKRSTCSEFCFEQHTDSSISWNHFSATTQLQDLFAAKRTRNLAIAVTTKSVLGAHANIKPGVIAVWTEDIQILVFLSFLSFLIQFLTQYWDPGIKGAKWNSAIVHFIGCIGAFLTLTL